jgi:hypothetical protein
LRIDFPLNNGTFCGHSEISLYALNTLNGDQATMAIGLPGTTEILGGQKRLWHRLSLSCFPVFIAILLISGCGGSGVVTVNSVSISPSSATVAPGSQADFTATVNLSNSTTSTSTSTTVTWEVNGVVGGSSGTGTITSSSTDNQLGVYTAPAVVPTTNNGQVNITAVAQQTNSTTSSTTATVTSNTAIVTVAVTQGFSISPPAVSSVPAGGTVQFSAILNGVTDVRATWSVSSATGGDPGTIGPTSGLYTAPLLPPTGNSITVTGEDGSNSASETITIVYSDRSLTGPYSFSYTGDNQLGFYAVAGSFVADGSGNIESGVEDMDSFQTGVTAASSFTGNYVVGVDGRGTVTLSNGNTWRFVLATNQHALILRSDAANTGSGTMDQQNLNALSNSDTVISGPYVFAGSGADTSFNPLAMAGRFSADGAGNVSATGNILDLNDGGHVTEADTSLSGSYSFDTALPGTGRGFLTLTSTPTAGPRQYVFYVIDSTHLRLLETDHNAYFSGDAFSALTGNSFSAANLSGANYVFKAGGNSSAGAYSAAGVFTSDGAGNVTGGAFDANNAGTVQTDASLTSCSYSVDSTTGRIDLKLCGAGSSEFALYQTAQNSAVIVELDATAISTGVAYQQSVSSTAPSGDFALSLAGQGVFYNAPGSYQQDLEGQIILNGSAVTGGTLDINNFSELFANNPINISTITSGSTTTPASTISAPGSNGRGTAVITGTNPSVTYKLVYYLINASSTLLFDQDSGFVLNGILTGQF